MKSLTLAIAAIVVLAPCAWADQITLKNGDRLTGDVIRSDAKTLVIKTEYAGDVTVQ
jgi:hypothetical protein